MGIATRGRDKIKPNQVNIGKIRKIRKSRKNQEEVFDLDGVAPVNSKGKLGA